MGSPGSEVTGDGSGEGLSGYARDLRRRADAAQSHARIVVESAQRLTGGIQRDQHEPAHHRQELLQHWPYARLLARLETLPTIEQAKGIVMAQSHCTSAAAFDMLRRASQRSNVPVRDLAAQIVADASKTVWE